MKNVPPQDIFDSPKENEKALSKTDEWIDISVSDRSECTKYTSGNNLVSLDTDYRACSSFVLSLSANSDGTYMWMKEAWNPLEMSIRLRAMSSEMNSIIYMDRLSLKFSSCSTIFLEDSTASCPHFETTLKSVAWDLYFFIKKREGYLSYKVFDEHVYPLKHRTEEYIMYDPSETMIYKFIRTVLYVKRLKVADAIISMVYIQRLIQYAHIYICSATWRRIILGAILVVIKVRSNVAVCNRDLCRRFEKTTVNDLKKLEMNFLELINYDTNVSKSVYTRYYFHLRDLVYTYGLGSPIYLLDTQRAWDLQALSRMEQYEVFYTGITRSLSVDDVTTLQRTKAILS
uniref:Cyclin N-terminal domain-containing protein n=1 Tax=Callithrix jacchus TaxID=9483 RepID=A0A8I4A2W6_CALJA